MNPNWKGRFAELSGDWRDYFERRSWRQALQAMGMEFLQLPYRHIHYLVVACSLTEPLPVIALPAGFTLRAFTDADVAAVAAIDRPSEARLCQRRIAAGHIGLAAFYEEQLVGHAWACKQFDSNIDRIDLHLPPSDCLCTDAYSAPAYRGRGIHTLLTLERFKIFRDLGYQRAICNIAANNRPSLRVWKKLGGQVIGELDYFRVGPWRWTHNRRGASHPQDENSTSGRKILPIL